MLTPTQIADEIERQIRALFPDEPCHRELCPKGFTRPCNLVIQEDCEIDVTVGGGQVRLQPAYTITTFVPVDEYHNSHLADLHMRQLNIAALFLPGFLRVPAGPDDKRPRAPHVLSLTTGGGYDYDTVTVTFDYAVDRVEFLAHVAAPTAGDIKARLTINEKE